MANWNNNGTGRTVDVSRALHGGVSKIKSRIRDIKRLLSRENLPSDLVVANERALKTLERELEDRQQEQKTHKMVVRYQKVRFFERKKAVRHYKTAVRKLKEAEDDEENKAALEKASVDLAYVLNFPDDEKYVALYAVEGEKDPEKLSHKEQKGLKKTKDQRAYYKTLFTQQLKDGKLRVSLEEGLAKKGEKKVHEHQQAHPQQKAIDTVEEGKASKEEDEFFE